MGIPSTSALRRMPKNAKHKIEARLSPIHGNGVFATELIKKG